MPWGHILNLSTSISFNLATHGATLKINVSNAFQATGTDITTTGVTTHTLATAHSRINTRNLPNVRTNLMSLLKRYTKFEFKKKHGANVVIPEKEIDICN